jgi:hypothetical protein
MERCVVCCVESRVPQKWFIQAWIQKHFRHLIFELGRTSVLKLFCLELNFAIVGVWGNVGELRGRVRPACRSLRGHKVESPTSSKWRLILDKIQFNFKSLFAYYFVRPLFIVRYITLLLLPLLEWIIILSDHRSFVMGRDSSVGIATR